MYVVVMVYIVVWGFYGVWWYFRGFVILFLNLIKSTDKNCCYVPVFGHGCFL